MSVALSLLDSEKDDGLNLEKKFELNLLDSGKECWIKLVGLRKSVGLNLLDAKKEGELSLWDLEEEWWIKLDGLR